jgi:hypothetical protein
MSKKEKQPLNTLEVQSVKGSLYRNGSVNDTLYFHIDMDEELAKEDEQYVQYYKDMTENEIFSAITNKFITSQPLKVSNDRIPFVIFKSNIDKYSLEEFCKAVLQEFSFHTGKVHTGQYGLTKTIFSEMGKESFRMHFVKKGEKFSRSSEFEEIKNQPLTFDKEPSDQGIMIPFTAWKEEKRQMQEAEETYENEEIVEW